MSRRELEREIEDTIKTMMKVARLEKERPGEVDLFVSIFTKRTEGHTICGRPFMDLWDIARKAVAIEKETGEVRE